MKTLHRIFYVFAATSVLCACYGKSMKNNCFSTTTTGGPTTLNTREQAGGGCCIYTKYFPNILACCGTYLYYLSTHHCCNGKLVSLKQPCLEQKSSRFDVARSSQNSEIFPLDCLFEQNTCGWKTRDHFGFVWERKKKSDIGFDGDEIDHCLTVEARNTGRHRITYITSPRVKVQNKRCLKFQYLITENTNLTSLSLQVLLQFQETANGKAAWENLPSAVGGWKTGEIDVLPEVKRISFVALKHAENYGAICIDNIQFLPTACGEHHSSGVDEFNCNFDSRTLCGWKQDEKENLDWGLNSGATRDKLFGGFITTGPLADHTTGVGTYVYIASDPGSVNDKARLVSPTIKNKVDNNHFCFSMWAHIKGYDTGTLKVLLVEDLDVETILWSKSVLNYDEDANWTKVDIDIFSDHFFIVVEASIKSYFGDIALDDVMLYEGLCGQDLSRVESYKVVEKVTDKPNLVTYASPRELTQNPTTLPFLTSDNLNRNNSMQEGNCKMKITFTMDASTLTCNNGSKGNTTSDIQQFNMGKTFVAQALMNHNFCYVSLINYADWSNLIYTEAVAISNENKALHELRRAPLMCGDNSTETYILRAVDFVLRNKLSTRLNNTDYLDVLVITMRENDSTGNKIWTNLNQAYIKLRAMGSIVAAVGVGSYQELTDSFKSQMSLVACGHPIFHLCEAIFFTEDSEDKFKQFLDRFS
ncbi:uncharacterized protein LOC108949763 [Ciona intestinalis]